MKKRFGLFAIVALFAAAPASAQQWDTPTFFAPRPGEDLGLYAVMPDGGDLGGQIIWRQAGNLSLGVRGGIGGTENNRAWLLGAEFYGDLDMLALPVDLAWILGFGAGFADDITELRIPLGVSIGTTLGTPGGFTIQPYVHPRVAFDLLAIGSGENEVTESDFNFPIDIGADVSLSESLVIKAGYTLNDFENVFGAGIAYRMPRRVRGN